MPVLALEGSVEAESAQNELFSLALPRTCIKLVLATQGGARSVRLKPDFRLCRYLLRKVGRYWGVSLGPPRVLGELF